jgi:hypothetical protein
MMHNSSAARLRRMLSARVGGVRPIMGHAPTSAFSLVEVMLASALTMVLMFGALYGTTESYEVVRAGDRRVHTHVAARRSLDRLLKDCRYAMDVSVSGSAQSGWNIVVNTTGSINPEVLNYSWDPNTDVLTVTDGTTTDVVMENLSIMLVETEAIDIGGQPTVTRISVKWNLHVNAGYEAGLPSTSPYDVQVGGASWVRRHVPSY